MQRTCTARSLNPLWGFSKAHMRFLLLPRCAPRYISGRAANVEGGATPQIARNGKDAVEEQVAYKVLKFCPPASCSRIGTSPLIFYERCQIFRQHQVTRPSMYSRPLLQTARSSLRFSLLGSQHVPVRAAVASAAVYASNRASFFSTSLTTKNEAKTQLHEVLSQELKFEESDAFGLDESFKTYLNENKIEIVKTDGKVLAELVKTTPTETIHIYFDILRISQTSYQLKQMQEQVENSEYLEEEIADIAFADVNVVVVKDKKATGFDLSLSLIDSSFSVSAITNFEDAKLALDESPESSAVRDLKYSGPEFNNLAEELQEAINHYLNSRGIDNALADFILAYSGVKENNEYLDWLDSLKKFTA